MMLVYSLPATEAIYPRFAGISGSAYFIGGFSIDGKRYCPCADPIGCWISIGRQCRLFEIHAAVDLESVLR
jgi:Envelope integrity protein A